MSIALRPYQQAATAALWGWLRENDGNPLVVASVGAGKSVMMAKFIRDCMEGWPDTRIVLATHSASLVQQNYEKLMALYPECDAGIYAAGLGRKQKHAKVLVGTIQSLWRKAFDLQDPSAPQLLIVDECHTISRKDQSMWGKFIAALKVMQPGLRVIGYSGSPFRLDSGYLHEGDDRLFDGVAFEIGMLELIEQGYLCPLVTTQAKAQIDLSNVHIRAGEYVASELEDAAVAATEAAVEEIVWHGAARKAWMVFASGRKSAFAARDAIRARGFSCETILADTPGDARADILERLRTGRLRCVTNVGTLTTGVDVPCVDLIAALFASKSTVKYIQVAGRGARLSPGKVDCLFLDHGGLIAEHGPVDQARPKTKKKAEPAGAPMKVCPDCEAEVQISVMQCPDCGHEFPPGEGGTKITASAASLAILSTQTIRPEWVPVTRVSYARHEKPGKQPSLCVTYRCGLAFHRSWVCFEHQGYAREAAAKWWNRRNTGWPVPATVEEALDRAHDLPEPAAIQVFPDGKYLRVVAERFA